MKRIFVTGISTEVGKTIASAIIAEALEADYWKPIQAGDLQNSDSHKVETLISNTRTVFHPNAYALKTPMSPHAAAAMEGIQIRLQQIREPATHNHLVIEGAGGLLVPLNDQDTILDMIQSHYKVVVVSRHYLGSINHTLLTLECLKRKGLEACLLFSGKELRGTEDIILKKTKVPLLGSIGEEPKFDRNLIRKYAKAFGPALRSL